MSWQTPCVAPNMAALATQHIAGCCNMNNALAAAKAIPVVATCGTVYWSCANGDGVTGGRVTSRGARSDGW